MKYKYIMKYCVICVYIHLYVWPICWVHTLRPMGWSGVCVWKCVCVRVPVCASICAVSMLPFHYIFKWFYTWYNRSLCLYRESAHACSSLPHCMCSTSLCASVYVHSGTSASASVHRGGNVWNGVAGEVLQLQQEGSLPVGKQLQQHWIRMQTQRHAYAHVGQQGDVCVMVWKIF